MKAARAEGGGRASEPSSRDKKSRSGGTLEEKPTWGTGSRDQPDKIMKAKIEGQSVSPKELFLKKQEGMNKERRVRH